jgi:hypothetical protein
MSSLLKLRVESEARRLRMQRNLHPHQAAVAAMYLYGAEYSKQGGGSMDFWDRLEPSRKRLCRRLVKDIKGARREHT